MMTTFKGCLIVAVIVAALAGAGCAARKSALITPVPELTMTQDQREKLAADYTQCEIQALRYAASTASPAITQHIFSDMIITRAINRCLADRGWTNQQIKNHREKANGK